MSVPTLVGGHDIFAYAHSSVSGAESVISVPVAIGEDPSKAGNIGVSSSQTCIRVSTGVMTTTTTTDSAHRDHHHHNAGGNDHHHHDHGADGRPERSDDLAARLQPLLG